MKKPLTTTSYSTCLSPPKPLSSCLHSGAVYVDHHCVRALHKKSRSDITHEKSSPSRKSVLLCAPPHVPRQLPTSRHGTRALARFSKQQAASGASCITTSVAAAVITSIVRESFNVCRSMQPSMSLHMGSIRSSQQLLDEIPRAQNNSTPNTPTTPMPGRNWVLCPHTCPHRQSCQQSATTTPVLFVHTPANRAAAAGVAAACARPNFTYCTITHVPRAQPKTKQQVANRQMVHNRPHNGYNGLLTRGGGRMHACVRAREATTQPTDPTTYSQRGPYIFCEAASSNNQEPQYVISPVDTASTPPSPLRESRAFGVTPH